MTQRDPVTGIVKIGTRAAIGLPPQVDMRFPPGYDEDLLCYWQSTDGSWRLNLPGIGLAGLSKHEVTVHDDGTITAVPRISVSPSILTTRPTAQRDVQAHGFLERSIWRDA